MMSKALVTLIHYGSARPFPKKRASPTLSIILILSRRISPSQSLQTGKIIHPRKPVMHQRELSKHVLLRFTRVNKLRSLVHMNYSKDLRQA